MREARGRAWSGDGWLLFAAACLAQEDAGGSEATGFGSSITAASHTERRPLSHHENNPRGLLASCWPSLPRRSAAALIAPHSPRDPRHPRRSSLPPISAATLIVRHSPDVRRPAHHP